MASELNIFSLYKILEEDLFFLIRTERPAYSNSSQPQDDLAYDIEKSKREDILRLIEKNFERKPSIKFELIGELQELPIGEKLYAEKGNLELKICYMETEYGKPWIILGNTDTEADFISELKNDEELLRLKPIGYIKQIIATFVTENDFDLSTNKNYKIKDVRPE